MGLGSNVGNREANLSEALRRLQEGHVFVTRMSPIYETEPVGITNQPLFLNAVAEAETRLFPSPLLACVKQIETAMKRRNTVRNGPRIIDIDILFYQSAIIKLPDLEVPHPRFRERRFVLAPLADLNPILRDPITHRTIAELLESASPAGCRRI